MIGCREYGLLTINIELTERNVLYAQLNSTIQCGEQIEDSADDA
jgi:hypothetical protein